MENLDNKDYMIFEYSGSNNVDSVAWYDKNSGGATKPVGTKTPNSLGLYDMNGNVFEWCWDLVGNYPSGAQTDPRGASSGYIRMIRGGSWLHSAANVRSAHRSSHAPSDRRHYVGFRLVLP
jgi:formylglycine-generating enzyme required for sulfatase activity